MNAFWGLLRCCSMRYTGRRWMSIILASEIACLCICTAERAYFRVRFQLMFSTASSAVKVRSTSCLCLFRRENKEENLKKLQTMLNEVEAGAEEYNCASWKLLCFFLAVWSCIRPSLQLRRCAARHPCRSSYRSDGANNQYLWQSWCRTT